MDFIVGILIVIIIILILINFTSDSVTDSSGKTTNSLFLTNKIINKDKMNQNQMNQNMNQYNIPSPMLSKEPTALNNKLNLNAQTYDYNKYFYL